MYITILARQEDHKMLAVQGSRKPGQGGEHLWVHGRAQAVANQKLSGALKLIKASRESEMCRKGQCTPGSILAKTLRQTQTCNKWE